MKERRISVCYIVFQVITLLSLCFFAISQVCGLNLLGDRFQYTISELTWLLAFSLIPFALLILKIKTTKTAQIYYYIALMGHFVGGDILSLYCTSFYYNFVLHMANSMFIGVFIYDLLSKHVKTNKYLFFVIVVACVMLLDIFWEFYEFAMDSWFGKNMQRHHNSLTGQPFVGQEALLDTMRDFAMDLFGAIGSCVIACKVKIAGKQLHEYFSFSKIPSKKFASATIEPEQAEINAEQNDDLDDDLNYSHKN